MRIDVYVHAHEHSDPRMDQVLSLLHTLIQGERVIMASFEDIKDAVDAETDVVSGVVVLLDGLAQQLADAIASENPDEIQAVLDRVNENKQKLADAVLRDTPTAPSAPPVEEPAPVEEPSDEV